MMDSMRGGTGHDERYAGRHGPARRVGPWGRRRQEQEAWRARRRGQMQWRLGGQLGDRRTQQRGRMQSPRPQVPPQPRVPPPRTCRQRGLQMPPGPPPLAPLPKPPGPALPTHHTHHTHHTHTIRTIPIISSSLTTLILTRRILFHYTQILLFFSALTCHTRILLHHTRTLLHFNANRFLPSHASSSRLSFKPQFNSILLLLSFSC